MKNEELIALYRKTGNKEYLDTLYNQNEKLLWRIVNEFNCELDETYLGFMEAVNRYDETKGKFTTLVYICCKNDILCGRRKKRIKAESLEKPTTEELTLGDMIEDSFDLEEDLCKKDMIKHYMKNLTQEEKAIVILYYVQDMKQKEIAEYLEMSVRQVQSRLTKAINKMKGVAYNGNR